MGGICECFIQGLYMGNKVIDIIGLYSLILVTSLSSVTCTAQEYLDIEGHISFFLHFLFFWAFSSLNTEFNNSKANDSSDIRTKKGSSRKERDRAETSSTVLH